MNKSLFRFANYPILTAGIFIITILIGCMGIHKRLNYLETYSASVVDTMKYGVYLPPGWDHKEPLPLVVFLHGGGDDELCFDRHHASKVIDEWINSGKLPKFIMLVPNGDMSFWVNWYDGTRRYRDYLMVDLLPKIRAEYPILPGRENCHIMGVSMGGFGAMHVAMHHSKEFASVSAISGLLFNPDQSVEFIKRWRKLGIERIFGPATDRTRIEEDNIYTWLNSSESVDGLHVLFGPASEDRPDVIDSNKTLHEHLQSNQIPHTYLTFEGKHNWTTWNHIYPVVLSYHLANVKLTPDQLPKYRPSSFDLGVF